MFDAVRKHQRLMLGLILLLILPAFVFFGVSGYDQMIGGRDEVAVVGGEPITRSAFEQAHRQQIERMQQMLGNQVDVKLFDTPQARAQTLEALITQQALLAEARAKRIAVPPTDVQKAVLAIEGLTGADGRFDFERYRTLLAQQNLTPALFEAQIAQELTIQALGNAVQDSAITPKTVVDRIFAAQEAQRTVRTRLFDPKELETGLKPTDAQLRAFYDEQTDAFQLPETVDVEYLVLDRSRLAAATQPSDDELKSYYEQNKAQFNEPEQRRASHILVPVAADADAAAKSAARDKATRLLAEVRAAPDRFADIAKANSGDPGSAEQGGDLGFFDRDMMVKPFSDAAFALKENEIAELVESEYGFHVIRVTGVKGSGTKPFTEVRSQIETLWRQQQGAKRFVELAESFTNTVYEQSDSLEPAVKKFGLELQKAERVGRSPSPAASPGSPLANPRLLGLLFADDALKSRRNTEAIEAAPGLLVSARVAAHQPSRRQSFDEVRESVTGQWIAAEAAKRAREQGEKLLASLKSGTGAAVPDGFSPAKPITRASPGDLSPAAVAEVFKLSPDTLPAHAGVDLGRLGYQVIRLEKAEGPDPTAESRRQLYAQQADRVAAQAAASAWIQSVKGRTSIERKLPAN